VAGMRSVVSEFKAFILRGNVLDLAVAVIIGAAFTGVVNAFTNGVLLAFVAAILGEPNFNDVTIGIGEGEILIGAFINALVTFVLVAAVLFLVIKAAAALMPKKPAPEEQAPVPSDEALLLGEIRDLLRVATRGSRGRPDAS
jgi:large conductance mechanosensitive channel